MAAETPAPFDPNVLIGRLPEFSLQDRQRVDGYTDYCQLYGIDFDRQHNTLAVEQRLGQQQIDGQQLAIHLFRPLQPLGTLLIVHGYLDHHGLYRHIIRYGLQKQLNVVCFDLPGHGLSTGPRAVIDDFGRYHNALAAVLELIEQWQLERSLHWLGQSTGAAIINQYLLKQRPKLDGSIALLAPLVRAANWPWVSLAHSLLSPWKIGVKRGFQPNSNDPAFCRFLKNDPLQSPIITAAWIGALKRWLPQFLALEPADYPLLIVQGEQDQTVDWEYNLEILAQKFPRQQQLRLPEGKHQLVNEAESIRQHYLAWLDQQGFGSRSGTAPPML